MALSSSGPIKFSQIKAEFGDSNGSDPGVSLGKYRVSETYGAMQNMPLDAGIPQSGTISMSDFYGKRLNIVINYYSGGAEYAPETGYQRYKKDDQKAECVGEFRNPPKNSNDNPETAGRTVWLHVNKLIGQTGGGTMGQSRCSFKTGNWQKGTDLRVVVGNEGDIRGRGGHGGAGGFGRRGDGKSGESGSAAIGIQYTNAVASNPYGKCYLQGYPQSKAYGGGGGGGGGGASSQDIVKQTYSAGGGGGGGGAGIPGGAGGPGGGPNLVPPQLYDSGDGGQGGSSGGGGAGGQGGRYVIGGLGLVAEGGNAGFGGGLGGSGAGGQGGKAGDDGQGGGGASGSGGNWLRTAGLTAGSSSSNQIQVQWQGSNEGGASSAGVS